MGRVLIIEDTDLMRESMVETLRRAGHAVEAFPAPRPALSALAAASFDAVVTDFKLPEMSGAEVLDECRRLAPEVPVLLVTAYATVKNAVEAMKKGAYDYLQKPFEPEALEHAVRRACEHHALATENEILRSALPDAAEAYVPGAAAAMQAATEVLQRAAATDATVLILGETGTGKEVAARLLHAWSLRRTGPFLCVNCAALSAGLLESELFGHEKGAFTGADRARKGRFELADGGTLLLDEVSEIDPGLQAKLLRVLQEKTFERVGSSVSRRADVRVLATTNRDLARAVREGRFREDLYYRLNVVPLALPPLRERRDDIPALAAHFLGRLRARLGRRAPELAPETVELLKTYDWPGNVRELGNVIERAAVLCRGERIEPQDIAPWLSRHAAATPDKPGGLAALAGLPLEEVEMRLIELNLAQHGGNREKTAQVLGISSRTLRDKLKKNRGEAGDG